MLVVVLETVGLFDAVIFNSAIVVRLADSARQVAVWQQSKDKATQKNFEFEKKTQPYYCHTTLSSGKGSARKSP